MPDRSGAAPRSTPVRRRVHGPAVRAIREALGIPHGVFAADCGLSAGYLTRIEQGVKHPSPQKAVAMARRLGVTLDAITYVPEPRPTRSDDEDAAA